MNGKASAQVACYITNSEIEWLKIPRREIGNEGTIIKTETKNCLKNVGDISFDRKVVNANIEVMYGTRKD